MKRKSYSWTILSLLLWVLGVGGVFADRSQNEPHSPEGPSKLVVKLTLEGAITPSSLDLLSEALDLAEEKKAQALLVAMDTPGGLVTSMDKMVRKILASPVPVITYISPTGAACGSAGVYILYSSHLAGMSPASNIGSATPVQMGGTPGGGEAPTPSKDEIPQEAGADDQVNLKRKLLNHSVAQIKSLATYHGRDPIFAERSITRAENITAGEALKRKVIEIIAESDEDLLKQAHGRTVRMVTGTQTLDLEGSTIVFMETDFRQNFLKFITDPNIAYILMMIGTLGILAEIQYPGSIFPGVAGVISLILGLYSMHTLSLSYAGFGLILVGLICFVLEVSIMSYGLLTIAGVLSMIIGALMLSHSGDEMARVSLQVALTTGLGVGAISAFLVYKAAETMRKKTASGDDYFQGLIGFTQTEVNQESGHVFINGEIWLAQTADGKPIPKDTHVIVVKRNGLILTVQKKEGN